MQTLPAYIFAMVALTVTASTSMHAYAGDEIPPPTLTTNPSPAPANQAFEAVFHYYWMPSAFGVRQDSIQIDGNTITMRFDHGCGFICPGTQVYAGFPFQLPPLAPGTYHLRIFDVSGDDVLAEFSLRIGATPIPTSSRFSLYALALLLLVVGSMYETRNQFVRMRSFRERDKGRGARGER